MSRIFITGSGGFVGRRLLPRLAGHDLVCLLQAEEESLPEGPTVWRGDLRRPEDWQRGLEGCDTVVHLASVTGKAPANAYFEVNLRGTEALLNAALDAGISRFLFISSIAVRFDDIRQYPYARSKRDAEAAVRESGIGHVIVRPTMVFGPGSPIQSALRSLAGLPASPVFDGGRARVQPIHVEDLADLLADVLEADPFAGTVLEFGGPAALSMTSLIARMRSAAGRSPGLRLHLPTAPLRPLLSLLERIDHRLAPFTVGQLASFRFDGVAAPNAYWENRRPVLRSVAGMLGEEPDS